MRDELSDVWVSPKERLFASGTPESSEFLSIDGLSISFGEIEVLHDISLEIGRGMLVGLIGPNGCGKSTMMKCISMIHRKWDGRVTVDGDDVSILRPPDLARLIATIPAEVGQTFGMTVSEFVMLGRYPFADNIWWESKDDEVKVNEALEMFGLADLRRNVVSNLSSGERQRVMIAKAYVQEPRLMLVDEPTSHLDMKYKLQVMRYLRSLSESGITVLVAEHDISLMARYCDVCIIMKQGSIVSVGEPKKIITEGLIREVYEVDSRVGFDADGEIYILPKDGIADDG